MVDCPGGSKCLEFDYKHMTIGTEMSNQQISKSEFKAKALEFFRQIEASGESIIITDHGKPALEVRPFRGEGRRPLDMLKGSVLRYENPTDPVADDEWEAAR